MVQNPRLETYLLKGYIYARIGGITRRDDYIGLDRIRFDTESLDQDILGLDAFAFDRISETEYVFTDFQAWSGNVGVWNIKTGAVQSICCKDKETDETLIAICGNKAGTVLALRAGLYRAGTSFQEPDDLMFRKYQYKEKEVSGYPLQQSFMLCEEADCKMEFLQDQLVLSLAHHELRLFSLGEGNAGWTSGLDVESYCRSDAGYLIATCYDGLYEISILDGSTTCIQKFMKKRVSFVLGRTSGTDSVILLENTGIVKWLDLQTGCCSRFVTIQCPKLTKDFQIFADEGKHTIMAVSGNRVTIWDSYSGATLKSYAIETQKDEILIGREIVEGDIVLYFESRNYHKFPMERRYYWNVEKAQWEAGALPSFLREYRKEPFRLHLSEDGSAYALECVDENARKKNRIIFRRKRNKLFDALYETLHLEEDDYGEEFVLKL